MEKIILSSKISQDEYTEFVCDNYDIQVRDEVITEIPSFKFEELNTFKWNIGILLGNSGSGKSTILSRLGELTKQEDIKYLDCSVISQFPMLPKEEVCELLHGVGLSSIPTWLKKPHELSNGERARLNLAWLIANTPMDKPILIDEFTSVVNRASAKSMSYSLQRYLRAKGRQVILASCHFDIVEWLKPDWIFNLNKASEECDLEHIVYSDDEDYVPYKKINEKDTLSDARSI